MHRRVATRIIFFCCVVLGAGCASHSRMTRELALVTLAPVPVPDAAKQSGPSSPLGRDSGGGVWFLAAESNEAAPLFETCAAAPASPGYYELISVTHYYPFLLGFYESTQLIGRRIDLPPRPPAPGARP